MSEIKLPEHKSGYIHGFSLLRVLLVVTVWIYHGWLGGSFVGSPRWAQNLNGYFLAHGLGILAVKTFFVLSGFMITRVALVDKKEGRNLRYFWSKRIARIAPPMAICLFTTAVLMPRFLTYAKSAGLIAASRLNSYNHLVISTHVDWLTLPYYNQWLAIDVYRRTNFFMSILWSLVVEEQFYLVWPIFLFTVKDHRKLETVAFFGVIAGVLGMSYYAGQFAFVPRLFPRIGQPAPYGLQIGTLPNVVALSIGVLIALREQQIRKTRLGYFALALAAVVGQGLFGYSDLTSTGFLSQIALAVTLVLFFLCVVEPMIQGPMFAFLRTKTMADIGAMTYGGYVYHMLIFSPINNLTVWNWKRSLITFVMLAWFTWFSYRFVERPIMGLVKRLKMPRPRLGNNPVPAQATTAHADGE